MRTKLVCNRYFPDPPGIGGESPLTISHGNLLQIVTAPPVPGIGGEQNGERKHEHCARTDSGGTPTNFSHITNLLVNNMPCPKKRR